MKRMQAISILREWLAPAQVCYDSRHATTIDLARQSFMVIVRHHAGVAISCRSGVLWITQSGSPGDTVLNAGQAIALAGRKDVVIQALHASTFEISEPQCQ